eukprot:120638-Pyramimonas_sp.AAC.1
MYSAFRAKPFATLPYECCEDIHISTFFALAPSKTIILYCFVQAWLSNIPVAHSLRCGSLWVAVVRRGS